MSLFLRAAVLSLLVLTRVPAFAAVPVAPNNDNSRSNNNQGQVCSAKFKHSLSGLYGIPNHDVSPLQPYSDFDVLFSKAHQAQSELETLCKSTALLTSSEAYFAGVKSQQRAQEKVQYELGGKAERITDLARATIVANDISSLMNAYEVLEREATIVKVKNRFKKPTESGYRDLNVLVQLPKTNMIAEVQLHLKDIADVKNGYEHSIYEQVQKIERLAAMEQRDFSDIERSQIKRYRFQSKELYQNAWLPYVTTNIEAA
ncbi:RelA/SpoT domain-containing protein [Vibrio comitans]|uniref:Phosphoribosylglycinamide formyltransferase n=1 Tax=Vibrio comitans NBRC 102076 TaxID=1219078 RepID=A0A4Y3IQ26_9VIBR|nr:RelA/SpoT domain-containing protein [Vibrio comitans]GEA61232.1 phosphoribosylglycinamide formyltransferase [Vibrio comitans NBRC 102076]